MLTAIISFSAFVDDRYAHAESIDKNLETVYQSLEKLNYRLDIKILNEQIYDLKDRRRKLLTSYPDLTAAPEAIQDEIYEINCDIEELQQELNNYRE